MPRGFSGADDFAGFGGDLRAGLKSAGYDDVTPVLQGSGVTARSYRTGAPFDVGRTSDFDVALASPQLLSRAKELGSAVGTYDMQARSYRPDIGRFLSQGRYEAASADLVLQSDPLTQNRYAFAAGNPINNVELDGHTKQRRDAEKAAGTVYEPGSQREGGPLANNANTISDER